MRYMGGKARIAQQLADVMLASSGNKCSTYLEPFLGAASVFSVMSQRFSDAIGSDIVPDLELLWLAARDGWVPPTSLTLDEWQRERLSSTPSALRAFAGFGVSYGGKWFGGYARDLPELRRYWADESSRTVVQRGAAISAQATIMTCDYAAHRPSAGWLVYCDPPYADTTGFGAVGRFDQGRFWGTAERWVSDGADVFVSGYGAPSGWRAVWTQTRGGAKGLRSHAQSLVHPERLFRHESQVG